MKSRLQKVALLLFVSFTVLFLYTLLHEGGHALAAWLAGGTVTEFEVNFFSLGAHISATGNFNDAQRALESVAGLILPLLVWLVFIALVPRRAGLTVELLKTVSSAGILGTLLPWIFAPALFALGVALPSDDTTHFLSNFHRNPWLAAAAFSLIFLVCATLFILKIESLPHHLRLWRYEDATPQLQSEGLPVGVLGGMLACGLGVVFLLHSAAAAHGGARASLAPPAGYVLASVYELSQRDLNQAVIVEFHTTGVPAGIFIQVKNIDTHLLDVSLAGPDGFRRGLLHGEAYSTALDSALLEQPLPAGRYQVLLTSRRSPGQVAVYLKLH